MPPSFLSTSSSVNFLRWGIEKLTAGKVLNAFVVVLVRLPPVAGAPFCAPLPSSILRFLVAGSAAGCEVWLRMYVEMSRKRVLCVGFWSFPIINDYVGARRWEKHTYGGMHALSQLMIAGKSDINFLGMQRRWWCRDGGWWRRSLYWHHGRRRLVVECCKGHGGCCSGLVAGDVLVDASS